MRLFKLFLIGTFAFVFGQLNAQLVVNPNISTTNLVNTLVGSGIQVSNITVNCPAGNFGSFNSANANVGIGSGIVLSTGKVTNALGPNDDDGSATLVPGIARPTYNDPQLTGIEPTCIYDVCIVEFDIETQCDQLTIDYVFASEEYLEFIGLANDAFGFFITGPNPAGGNYNNVNVATLPGTSIPVAINNVNDFTNSSYFIDNGDGDLFTCFFLSPPTCTNPYYVQYDGLTVPLTATLNVVPCANYHLKLAIGDAYDDDYDSGVFLAEAGISCSSFDLNFAVTPDNCGSGIGAVTVSTQGPVATFQWGANANNATTATISNLLPGTYYVTATFGAGCPKIDSVLVPNISTIAVNLSTTSSTCSSGANGGSASLTVSGGTGVHTTLWSTGATVDNVSGLVPGNYSVTVTDQGCSEVKNFTITGVTPVVVSLPNDTAICGTINYTVNGTTAGATGYLWSNGTASASLNITAAGSYTLTATSATGCTASDVIIVTQATALAVNLPADTAYCATFSRTLNATTTGATSYLWSDASVNPTLTVSSAGTYSVTVTNAAGCTGTDAITISASSNPVVTVNTTDAQCGAVTGAVGVSVIAPNAHNTSWSGGQTGDTIASLNPGNYTVTVTDAVSGCETIRPFTINQTAALSVTLPADTAYCGTFSRTLNATTTGATSYLWSDASANATLSVAAGGTYSVTVSNGTGCTGTDAITISASSNPVVTVNTTNAQCGALTGAVGVTVTAQNAYNTNWSGGQTGDTIASLNPGNYTVTVIDAVSGCETIRPFTINQTAALSVTLPADTAYCGTFSRTLNATTTGATGYLWSDATVNPTLNVSAAGTYSVTVTNAAGCTGTDAIIISASSNPVVTVNTTNAQCGALTGAAGVTVTAPNAHNTSWSGGQTGDTVATLAPGSYTVTVTDAVSGCQTVRPFSIVSSTQLLVNLPADTAYCGNFSRTLNATTSGATGYLWSDASTNPTLTVTAGGTYSVTVSSGAGCSGTDAITITQNQEPTVNLASVFDLCIVGNGKAYVDVTTAQATYTATWSTGLVGDTAVNLTGGSYRVSVTDGTGCDVVQSFSIPVANPASVTLPADMDICETDEADITATGTGTFEWSTGETLATITAMQSDVYSVTITNADNCTATDDIAVTITPAPQVTITSTDSLFYACEGPSAELVAEGVFVDAYRWSTGDVTAVATIFSEGTYVVTGSNSCGAATDTIRLEREGCTCNVYVPNAFSPNGDGRNELFIPQFSCEPTDYYIEIFNRWGEKVYLSADFSTGWDGTYKGKRVNPDVFVYYLSYTANEDGTLIQSKVKGSVAIVR